MKLILNVYKDFMKSTLRMKEKIGTMKEDNVAMTIMIKDHHLTLLLILINTLLERDSI